MNAFFYMNNLKWNIIIKYFYFKFYSLHQIKELYYKLNILDLDNGIKKNLKKKNQ